MSYLRVHLIAQLSVLRRCTSSDFSAWEMARPSVREASYDDPSRVIPSVYYVQPSCIICMALICQAAVFIFRETSRSSWAVALSELACQFPLGLQRRCICSQTSRKRQPPSVKSTPVLQNGPLQFYKWKHSQKQSGASFSMFRIWPRAVSTSSLSVHLCHCRLCSSPPNINQTQFYLEVTLSR